MRLTTIAKRGIDLIGSVTGLVLLSIPMSGLWILVRMRIGAPAIFRQSRPGRDGAIFELYKFRTMTEVLDADGRLMPDEARLTDLGRFLRRTSLDELPELFNVLR